MIRASVFTCSANFTPSVWGWVSFVVNECQDEANRLFNAFNAANTAALADLFLAKSEFVDKEKTVYWSTLKSD